MKLLKNLRLASHTAFVACILLQLMCPPAVVAQKKPATRGGGAHAQLADSARDREIASQFAPVFRQGLGDRRRYDYITNFDFDGDWRGDNNWDNADDARFPQRAYVYYAVSETPTHFFVHYAVFHPRDYKGDSTGGRILTQIMREGVRRGGRYDPTGLSGEAVLAHENDMEGCLVVASKAGDDVGRARVVFVETLAHDRFLKYMPGTEGGHRSEFDVVRLEAGRPELYVEARGHGIYAYDGGEKQMPSGGMLVYKFAGQADDPEQSPAGEVGYALLPLSTTLWPRARGGVNQTFGAVHHYGARAFSAAQNATRAAVAQRRNVNLGSLGVAFRGNRGAPNAARPPWGWFDRSERGQARGEWFFDPAATVKRHFGLDDNFSVAYTHAPFLGVSRK
ncbi:MAG TPA: hypothetical protein VEY11_15935 [Pyrinomonadaceae bacterium]|nr:hypothetical protein [Pyrinomonadaceae bacterium]